MQTMRTNFNPLISSDIETVETPKAESEYLERPSNNTNRRNNNPLNNFGNYVEDIFGYDQQPEHRVGYRTYFAAFALFFGGLILVIFGAVEYWESEEPRGLDLFIIGLVMMLPGTYGMTIVIGHLRGWFGYNDGNLPLYD